MSMQSFKKFFEDQETALVPSAGEPLSSFLQRFEGSTIKQILDKSSFVSMYFMNKTVLVEQLKELIKPYKNLQKTSHSLLTEMKREEVLVLLDLEYMRQMSSKLSTITMSMKN